MLQNDKIDGQDLSENLRVLQAIRHMVTDDLLPSDGRLPTERRLAIELGAGRRSVRYALDRLEAEGLVWRKQGKGTFVGQPPDPTEELAAKIVSEVDPLTAMEARLCIEPALADLCARRATADDVDLLRQLAERTHEAGEAEAAELWDGALHRAIARIAGNRVMLTAFTLIDEVRMGEEWQRKRHRARTPKTRAAYDAQHSRIIDAIDARDGAAAAEAMREHLKALFSNLKTSLEKEGQ
ncbi:FCD domain-containing protein [Aestuariivita sp.]|jgi:DNA-binding FadR family transcriptional regulator|uniref:FadR/GntR family transcriptional regulator n=1 Tax=Aestuariivita sp. TaxID=1872407 RepID=UPI00217207DF|nr:FCD domain-containing protein [Aestuariivita sp.]MCE8009827.1 FadR family transcriptional regulator [Aestuariivita sp.]